MIERQKKSKQPITTVSVSNNKKNVDTNIEEAFIKAYLTDKAVFGESTKDIYVGLFDELSAIDASELFEAVEESFENSILSEDDKFAKEMMSRENVTTGKKMSDDLSHMMKNRDTFTGSDVINRSSADWIKEIKDSNPNLLTKVGRFFKGLKDDVADTKVFDSLKNGLSWVISPEGLPIVAGSAAGLGILYAIVKVLRKNGKGKKADKVEAAIKKAKEEKKSKK